MASKIRIFSDVWCVCIDANYYGNDIELWDLTFGSLSYPVLVPMGLMASVDPFGGVVDVTLFESNGQIVIFGINDECIP